MSLRLLIRALRSQNFGFDPLVILPRDSSSQLAALYENEGSTVSSVPFSPIDGSIHAFRIQDRLRARAATHARRRSLTMHVLKDCLDTARPDLVHLNGSTLGAAAELLLERSVPFVWHIREPPYPRRSTVRTWLATLMAQSPAVVFLSEHDRQSWLPSVENHHRTFVVPNAVDVTDFRFNEDTRGEVRSQLGIKLGAPVALYVGGLVEIKGAREILNACADVRRVYSDVRFLMPGADYVPAGGPLARRLRRALNLAGYPTFGDEMRGLSQECGETCLPLPATTEVHKLFAAADVVTFPSLVPHFARPVIEAMAAGCSVVASDLPGVRELTRLFPEDMVKLIPPGNVEALAHALVAQLGAGVDAATRDLARRQAQASYGLERHGKTILEIYRRVLQLG